MYKQISIFIIAALAATLITASIVSTDVLAAKKGDKVTKKNQDKELKAEKLKKKKAEKCGNLVLQVKVNGVEENNTLIGSAHIDNQTKAKTTVVEANETSAQLTFAFNKMISCPAIGDSFSGFVNGTSFTAPLNSMKKPTKTTVELS